MSLATLSVIVDYDNVEPALKMAGPVSLAKTLLTLVPVSVLTQYDEANVRLYGGWRSGGSLTHSAQRLAPDIRSSSPAAFSVESGADKHNIRLVVELADRPLGLSTLLGETYVKDRNLRKFRARRTIWNGCSGNSCGFASYENISSSTACPSLNCSVRMVDILVRDEQKMVDTLMVADIAKAALIDKCKDLVIVSSDTDVWPGLLLALNAGCYVTHVHTKQGWSTQRHLLQTLQGHSSRFYLSTSP